MPAQNQLPSGWSTLPPGWSASAPGGQQSSAAPAEQTSDPGPLDQLASWGAKTFPNVASRFSAAHPATSAADTAEEFSRPGGNIINSAIRNLTAMPAAAAGWVEQGFKSPDEQRAEHQRQNAAGAASMGNKTLDPNHAPVVTPEMAEDFATDTAGGLLAGGAAGEAVGGILRAPGAMKKILSGPVDEPMAGSTVTPRQRYDAAKKLGVNLPPAQATNSSILKPLDWINKEGLLSAPMHERLNTANVNALTGSTDELLNRMSPLDPQTGGELIQQRLRSPFVDLQNRAHGALEEMSPLGREQGGARLQSLLKGDQEKLQTTGGEQEHAIREAYGDLGIGSYDPLRSTARTLQQQNEPVDSLVPGLAQKHTRNILQSIANFGEDPVEGATAPVRPTVGNALDMRTRLMRLKDFSPEQAADPDIDDLISATHQTIANSLPPEGQKAWLDANAIWKDKENTYNNPSSPFYNAVRTPNPSTLADGIGGTSPEAIRAVRKRAGKEGVGIVGRGVGENLLGKTAEGEYNLKNFGSRLERMPAESRDELFGNAGHENLQRIGSDYRAISPFEKAAYTGNPESLVQGIKPETAAGVRQMRDIPVKPEGAVGPPAPRIGEEGMGAIRRGVATDLLGTTADNGYNFPNLPGKLARMNEGYRSELFGPHEETLHDIGDTSRALDTNYNRSGSGKQAQKVLEAVKLATGLPLLQIPLAKFMTSPAASEWLMKPSGAPNPLFRPGAGAAVGAAAAHKRRSSPFEQ